MQTDPVDAQLENLPTSSLPSGVVSSSFQTIQNLYGTNIISGSEQRSVLGLGINDSPSFNNLTLTGDLTARQIIVSSSVYVVTQSFSSGSTIFGDSSNDTHQFTGSVYVSGSIYGTFVGDGSGLENIVALGTISSSQQIADFGFITSSLWEDIVGKPNGLVSSSLQILSETNIVSSSTQILSNLFGTNIVSSSGQSDTSDDIHQFTGSMVVTGSTTINGDTTLSGDLLIFTGSAYMSGSLNVEGTFVLPTTNELPAINSTGSLVISGSNLYLFI